MRRSFESIYCQRYRVRRIRFQQTILVETCSWFARPLAKLLCQVGSASIKDDLHRIAAMGRATARSELLQQINELQTFHRDHLPVWRRALGLRPSTARLKRLSRLLY